MTVKFNLTPEMATLAYTYEIATGQALNNVAPNLIVYVNGVEFTRKTAAYQYGNISLSFPAGTFRAGENKIAWRYDPSKHASNYWVGIRAHRFHVDKTSLPKYGMMFIVR